jgi:ABC-type uncharacterized transport system substrate-binding protein
MAFSARVMLPGRDGWPEPQGGNNRETAASLTLEARGNQLLAVPAALHQCSQARAWWRGRELCATRLQAISISMKRLCVTLALMLPPQIAGAHPHIFIEASAGLHFDTEGRLTGLHLVWLYDAFTTLVLYDQLQLDADGDGALDAGDLAKVAAGETDWSPDYPGDTYLRQGGAPVALGKPDHARARMIGDKVEVSFDLPLAAPLIVDRQVTSLKLYDPSYYYAYTLPALAQSMPLPDGCQTQLIRFEPSDADNRIRQQLAALSAEEIPDDPEIGARFADELRLTCD